MKNRSLYIIPLLLAAMVLFTGIVLAARFSLYYRFPGFDKMLHLFGGIAVAWLFLLFYKKELGPMPFLKQYIFLLSGFSLVGVFWEFAEFASGQVARYRLPVLYYYFHGGDMNDTIGDLAAGLIGATIVAILWKILSGRTTATPVRAPEVQEDSNRF